MKRFAFASCIGILAFAAANAQEFSRFSFEAGAGYTNGAGGTARYLDEGWNVGVGAGVNFTPYLGTMLNVGYDSLGINSGTLSQVGVPGGGVHVFHATIDPIVHVTGHRRLDLYLTAGGGLFHRYQEFTAPVVVTTAAYIPFLGFYPVTFGANQVLASYSVNKPGFDVGGGVGVRAAGHGEFFIEAKWDHMFMSGGHTDIIPVTFGFRW